MARSLSELENVIMTGNHTMQEWLLLDKEVDEAIAVASEKEIQVFVDSGAGEMLDMSCSAIREIEKQG